MSEISVNEQQQTSEVVNLSEQSNNAPQQSQEVHFDDGIWDDEFIGTMFSDENAPVEQAQAVPNKPQEEAPADQEQQAQEEAPKQEEPTTYEVEIFDGQKVNLNEQELQEAVEYGAMYAKNKPQIEKSLQLSNAVQKDPNLQAILKAYAQGQPLPQFHAQNAPQQAHMTPQEQQKFSTQNEALQAFRGQVIQEVLPQLKEMILAEYAPFVKSVEDFKQSYSVQREFAEIQKDSDYTEVDSLMSMNIKHKLNEGAITIEQAAMLENKLRTDPKFYKEWFGKFKAAKNAKPAQETKTVTAPKVATNSQVTSPPTTWGDLLGKAIEGEDEAIGALFT